MHMAIAWLEAGASEVQGAIYFVLVARQHVGAYDLSGFKVTATMPIAGNIWVA